MHSQGRAKADQESPEQRGSAGGPARPPRPAPYGEPTGGVGRLQPGTTGYPRPGCQRDRPSGTDRLRGTESGSSPITPPSPPKGRRPASLTPKSLPGTTIRTRFSTVG